MSLPGPESISWADWKNLFKIITPTFDLTPIEKPDTSPFLIHMTGKKSLVSILKGENAPEGMSIPAGHGYLKAVKPDYDNAAQFYNSKVVCFTESPTFALDFFRYRSFNRWYYDQKYGIGFLKSALIEHRGVRPVIYLDTSTNRDLLSFCLKIENNQIKFSETKSENDKYINLFKKIKPLLFPLLEDNSHQGFSWEREWRCPNEDGLQFMHESIKIICCPKEEKAEIEEILGDLTGQIQLIESWKEYDEVTDYLKRRNDSANKNIQNIEAIEDITTLQSLKNQNDQTLNSLTSYYEVFTGAVDKMQVANIDGLIKGMQANSAIIQGKIESLIEKEKARKEVEDAAKLSRLK